MKNQKGYMLIHFTKKLINLDLWASTKEELQEDLSLLVSENKDARIVPYYKEDNKAYLEMASGSFVRIQ